MKKVTEVRLKKFESEDRGALSFFEAERDFPFKIRRIYYTYGVPKGAKRGMHAHKDLEQILWCPYGVITVIMDNGREKSVHILDSPEKLIFISKGYWHEMHWDMEGSVLCAAASDYYNEEDYIRDYAEFIKSVNEGYWEV